jgi:trk system potassium uptake protein TrkH
VQQAARELRRLIHPQLIAPLRFGSHVVPNAIVYAILAFIFFYFLVIVGVSFVLMASGMEVVTAFSASIAWINNIGPALNEIGPAGNFSHLTDFQKWVGIFAMLTCRLELFTVLVLFTPAFWRK